MTEPTLTAAASTDVRLSPFGEIPEQSKRRRYEHRWIWDYLRSDLYEREHESDTDNSMTLVSPLGWRVTITIAALGWTVDIHRPNGDMFERLPNGTVDDLRSVLP